MTQQSNGEKLTNALKDETLMKKVGQLASDEQKSTMTQSTVEERLNEKLKLCISRIGGINCQCGNPISLNRVNDLWIDFIKSEIQLAEQKAREDLKKVIIEKGIDLIDIDQDINLT